MRYLPTLDFGKQVVQLELPDVHALDLAEIVLTKGKDCQEELIDLLLKSPMLLFWVSESWKSKQQPTGSILLNDAQLVEGLLAETLENATQLVGDNRTQLTSIQRIGASSFLDVQKFFEIVDTRLSVTGKVIHRIAILESVLPKINEIELSCSSLSLCRTEQEVDRTIREYSQTDFSQQSDSSTLEELWSLDLPNFKSGFGLFEKKLDRLMELEFEFHELVEKEKLLSMQQLAYGASHEINNPLANISTRAQALLRDETDPKRRQRLQTIDAQAFRAHDMISNLMTFAKPRKPEPERFQVRPVVEESVRRLIPMAESQDITISIDCESAVYLSADKEQLHEMIFALVENAMESIRRNGSVRVQCMLPDDSEPILIEVLDNGPGISPETRKHIFDPFYSGREAGRGLGFGLSKVYRLMELHHGTIEVGEQDGWTKFELRFPAQMEACSMAHGEIEKTA